MPCVFSSGGSIGPAAKKIIDKIAVKIAQTSMDNLNDIRMDIKTDVVISLLKSRIQGIRSTRNSIVTQMNNFKLTQLD